MGITLRELIERHAGGVRGGWDNLLAVIPGGASVPLPAGVALQRPRHGFRLAGKLKSGLGTAAVIVMDKSTDIVRAIARLSYFYKHESCGQCTPCREGTGWMWRVLERMADGRAEKREIDMLLEVTTRSRATPSARSATPRPGRCRASSPHFRPEIERRIDSYTQRPQAGRRAAHGRGGGVGP